MYHEELIKLYDNYWEQLKIAPVAHTKISSDFVVLLDATGYKMAAELHEYMAVPCTVESETRTSNIAPHLLHDNLSYVGNMPGYEDRYSAYLDQLKNYVDQTSDPVAKVIYEYVVKGTVLDDIMPLIKKSKIRKPPYKINVVFLVYPQKDTIDINWTNYYVNHLPKNGMCMATGVEDFIPDAYPTRIRSKTDMAKLFVGGCGIGYVASQKIIHTLQVMAGGNADDIAAEIKPKKIDNFKF